MSKRVTITDIAKASGVSAATVSRVLNGNTRVAPELVERVELAIREHNYHPNGVGRALRRQKVDLWAAIVPDIRNPFFHRLLEAFEEVAHHHGYAVMLCNSHEDLALEQSAIDAIIAHQASGVLIAAVSASKTSLRPLQLQGIPVVSVDRVVTEFRGDCVNVDNQKIGRIVAEHLLEQGWQSPVVLGHGGELSSLDERVNGFLVAMQEAGSAVPAERVHHLPFTPGDSSQRISEIVSNKDVDAVFAVTNTLTAEAYHGLRRAGRAIGREVALVGIDDDRWNSMVDPPVTVVDQPAEHLGEWAAQLLLGRSTGNAAQCATMILEPQLRVRASSSRNS